MLAKIVVVDAKGLRDVRLRPAAARLPSMRNSLLTRVAQRCFLRMRRRRTLTGFAVSPMEADNGASGFGAALLWIGG